MSPVVRKLALVLLSLAAVAAAVYAAYVTTVRLAFLENRIAVLQDRVRRLSYNTASGGGVNVKMMPDPVTGLLTVPLEEVFSFDRNHVMCRVDTNVKAFKMRTYKLGEIVVPPHEFFMSMTATSVDQYAVSKRPDGTRHLTMRGGLECATEVGHGQLTVGSRSAIERARYVVEAVDGGMSPGRLPTRCVRFR